MADPWAAFIPQQQAAPADPNDPWNAFRAPKEQPQQAAPATVPTVGVGEDVLKSAIAAPPKAVLGAGSTVTGVHHYIGEGLDYLGNKAGVPGIGPIYEQAAQHFPKLIRATPAAQAAQQQGDAALYQPQTPAGHYTDTGVQFLTGAPLAPGSVPRKIATTLASGLTSEAAGQATQGSAAEPYARFLAAVGGAMVPGAGARALNPFQPSAERQAAATTMRNEGVPVTAGQVTGNPILKAVENPFGTFNENQLKNFTEAAMSRTGQRTLANPEHIDAALNRIGGEFDRVGSTHDVIPDPQLYNDVQSAMVTKGSPAKAIASECP